MQHTKRLIVIVAIGISAMVANSYAQENPYREDGWAKLPDGRRLGQMSAVDIDRAGNVWTLDRCGADSCAGSKVTPVIKFDPTGKYLTSFGANLFVFPHGMHFDKDGNVWVTDASVNDGKVNLFIPGLGGNPDSLSAGEAGAADAARNVYWAETTGMVIRKFFKQ